MNSILASKGCPSLFNKSLLFKRLERLARISYTTDFKVLGSVFGSYCADLKLQCCCKELSVPRLSALNRLLLEDSIQTIIQIIYVSSNRKNALFMIASISLTVMSFLASFFSVFITAGSKPSEYHLEMFEERKDHCMFYQSQLTMRLKENSIKAEGQTKLDS